MKNTLYIICLMQLFFACNFLDEQSQDKAYALSCDDLNELLIGNGYMYHSENNYDLHYPKSEGHYYPWIFVVDDDVENYSIGELQGTTAIEKLKNFYIWATDPFVFSGLHQDDTDWKRLYGHISVANVILEKVKSFTSDPVDMQRKVKGEAYFLRAAYYFLLTNIYGEPYEKSSATTKLGVPLKLVEYVENVYFSRNTLEECYAQIVQDLKEAISNLKGIEQPSIYRANEAAAHLLLSRVYLYMNEWELALEECLAVEALGGYELLNLSEAAAGEILVADSKEIIFTQGNNVESWVFKAGWTGSRLSASDDLMELFDQDNDLRYAKFFQDKSGRKTPYKVKTSSGTKVSDGYVLRYAEVLLNKAEALAMLGERDGEAIEALKQLLKYRYASGQEPVISASGEELVNYIRNERRRELCFEGHRWFDLRRYAVSSKYSFKKGLEHSWKGNDNEIENTYSLAPYPEGKAWVLEIPSYELEFNRNTMIENGRLGN